MFIVHKNRPLLKLWDCVHNVVVLGLPMMRYNKLDNLLQGLCRCYTQLVRSVI